MFFSLLHRKWSCQTWAPQKNLLSSSECICSLSIFTSLHFTSEEGKSILSSWIDCQLPKLVLVPCTPNISGNFFYPLSQSSHLQYFLLNWSFPLAKKSPKYFFLIFWSCTFLKLCFLSVLSNSFNRFYLLHASYLLFKTIYSDFRLSIVPLEEKGRDQIAHSFTPQVQSKESDFLSFPESPQVRLWSPMVDTAPWLHPPHWPPPTARPTSSKHYPPGSSPQRLLLREPKSKRNFFKPCSVNSHSLLSSQIFSFLPRPLSVIAVFSVLIFWFLY